MKKKTIWIAGITATVIVLLLLAGYELNKCSKRVKGILREQVQKALPHGSVVGDIDFSLLSSMVEIHNIRIPNPDGYSKNDAISIQSISAELDISALSDQVIHFKSLQIKGGKLFVEFRNVPKDFRKFVEMKWPRSGVNLLEMKTKKKIPGNEMQKVKTTEPEKKKKIWRLQIDKLEIVQSFVVLGSTEEFADIAEQAVEQLIQKIPKKYTQKKITMLSIGQLKNTAVDWMKKKIRSFGNREFSIPNNAMTDIKIAEITKTSDAAAEFAGKHVEEFLNKLTNQIETKYNALTKQLGKWLPEKTIQKLVYTETGPFGPTERYTIDFKEDIYTYECSNTAWEIGKKDYVKHNLDQKSVRQIKNRLLGFNAKKWKDRYSNPNIIDGTFWNLQISFSDGSSRRISGANAWPSDFSKRLQFSVDSQAIVTDAIKKAVKE